MTSKKNLKMEFKLMNSFSLKIFTPDGLVFDENIYEVSIKTIDGDISILPGHVSYITAIDRGKCKIFKTRGCNPDLYNCENGFLIFNKNVMTINLEIFSKI